jgi:DNA topoisomerase III
VKNYEFNFRFAPPWGDSTVTMTSVLGHLNRVDFPSQFKKWSLHNITDLFEANVVESVDSVGPIGSLIDLHIDSVQDKTSIAENIARQARYARALFIWTDCDLEGEHIGSEVRKAAQGGNARIEVKRARFSNTERA